MDHGDLNLNSLSTFLITDLSIYASNAVLYDNKMQAVFVKH